ncbi:glycosyltransferase [Butyrivibrio sp. XBB1001]|uniref:glycosyltransferase n=1 Tax=Butyrivibrio sp. XBB1001 TaxID=1280682 RepID=UPI00041C5494|nr:glycosyltransferase [Butyrivibrio sp. XBB1001]
MKILFVLEQLRGGAERVTVLLASEFSKRIDDEIHICVLFRDEVEYDLPNNINVHYLEKNYTNKYIEMINEYFFLQKEIIILSPDVVVSLSTYRTDVILALANIKSKCVLIESERNDPRRYPNSYIKQVCRNWAYSQCDGVVFQTEDARKLFDKKIKSAVIANPVCVSDDMVGNEMKNRHIVCCARLEPQKNIPLLIEAFYDIVQDFPDLSLHIFGKGHLEKELQKKVRQLGIEEKVIFEGVVNNVISEIKDAFCYIMTSDYEGISNAMLEAVALGVPTIATDCPVGGARKVLENGKFGILVPVGDKDAIVTAVRRLLKNPEVSEEFRKRSAEIRSNYSVTKIANQWKRFITDCIYSRGGK